MKITIDIPDTTVSNYAFYEMKMVANDLKPCPFCGSGKGALYIVTVEQHGYETVGIFCNACKQTVTLERNEWEGLKEDTKERAIEAWNRRADDKEVDDGK